MIRRAGAAVVLSLACCCGTLVMSVRGAAAQEAPDLPEWHRAHARDLPPDVFARGAKPNAPSPTAIDPAVLANAPFVIEQKIERVRFESDGRGRIERTLRVRVQNDDGAWSWRQLAARPGDLLSVHTMCELAPQPVLGEFRYEQDVTRDAVVLDEQFWFDLPADRDVSIAVRTGIEDVSREHASEAGPGRRLRVWRTAHLSPPDAQEHLKQKGEAPSIFDRPAFRISTPNAHENSQNLGRPASSPRSFDSACSAAGWGGAAAILPQ